MNGQGLLSLCVCMCVWCVCVCVCVRVRARACACVCQASGIGDSGISLQKPSVWAPTSPPVPYGLPPLGVSRAPPSLRVAPRALRSPALSSAASLVSAHRVPTAFVCDRVTGNLSPESISLADQLVGQGNSECFRMASILSIPSTI